MLNSITTGQRRKTGDFFKRVPYEGLDPEYSGGFSSSHFSKFLLPLLNRLPETQQGYCLACLSKGGGSQNGTFIWGVSFIFSRILPSKSYLPLKSSPNILCVEHLP